MCGFKAGYIEQNIVNILDSQVSISRIGRGHFFAINYSSSLGRPQPAFWVTEFIFREGV
jgi:hypothetical protein